MAVVAGCGLLFACDAGDSMELGGGGRPDADVDGGPPAADAALDAESDAGPVGWCDPFGRRDAEPEPPLVPPFEIPSPGDEPVETEWSPGGSDGRVREPVDLGFGRVRVGEQVAIRVEITNDGPTGVFDVPGALASCDRRPGFCWHARRVRVAGGSAYSFELAFLPTESTPSGEVASLQIRRDGTLYRTLVVDGSPSRVAPVVCTAPANLAPVAASGCASMPVACRNQGLGPAALSRLEVDSASTVRSVDGPPLTAPQAPLALSADGQVWRFEVCPGAEGPFAADVRWAAEGAEVSVLTVRGEARGGELWMPADLVFPVQPGVVTARAVARNVGLEPVHVTGFELEGPFGFAEGGQPIMDPLAPGEELQFELQFDGDDLRPDRPAEGRLQVFARSVPGAETRLAASPSTSRGCELDRPASLDLGARAPRRSRSDGVEENDFFTSLRNVGAEPCRFALRGEGLVRSVSSPTHPSGGISPRAGR